MKVGRSPCRDSRISATSPSLAAPPCRLLSLMSVRLHKRSINSGAADQQLNRSHEFMSKNYKRQKCHESALKRQKCHEAKSKWQKCQRPQWRPGNVQADSALFITSLDTTFSVRALCTLGAASPCRHQTAGTGRSLMGGKLWHTGCCSAFGRDNASECH